jgi:hypothetical protein
MLDNKFENFIHENPGITTKSDAKSLYLKFLSHFCRSEEKPEASPEEIIYFDESMISEIPVIICPNDKSEIDKVLREASSQDIVLLRGFYEALDEDETVFSLSEIENEFQYKLENLNLIEKKVTCFSFIHDSEDKQIEAKAYSLRNELLPKQNLELNCKLSKIISFNSKENALQYVNNPDSLKNYTSLFNDNFVFGAQQQEAGLLSFNINHGPGENIFYAVSGTNAKNLRRLVKQFNNYDIYTKDKEWYVEADTCAMNRINVHVGKQKKGDILLVGHNVLYW